MTVTTHEQQNARKLLEEKRQEVKAGKPRQRTGMDNAIDKLIKNSSVNHELTPQKTNAKPMSIEDIKRANGIVSLSELTTEHMNAKQRKEYNDALQLVRGWRECVISDPRRSFILCSRQYGIGKTHIAKAVMGSFATICMTGEDFNAPPIIEQHGIMLTSRESMALLGDDDWKVKLFHQQRGVVMRGASSLRVLVLDDVGREGKLPYVKAEHQHDEIQSRYYEIVNWCYEKGISLFITSNMQPSQLEAFFNEATWDRLNEMAPKGCITVLEGIPSYRKLMSGRGQ